jgi:SRSO17 transposase
MMSDRPTMQSSKTDWEGELGRWLEPFLERLGHKTRRRMCPLYVAGLIGPGDRKSVAPMAERFGLGDYDRMHHFRRRWRLVCGSSGDRASGAG